MNADKFRQLHDLLLAEAPAPAAAIVWLQGDRLDRAGKTLALYQAGYSDTIVLTGNNALVGAGQRPGENNISLDDMHQWLLQKGVPESAIRLDAASLNTKDQADTIMSWAKEKGWPSIILVGSSYYQPRAFLTFLKAARRHDWPGRIINQPAPIPGDAIPSGREETAHNLMDKEMGKIEKYVDDVEPIAAGLEYLSKNL